MENELKRKLEALNLLVFCTAKIGKDVLSAPLHYELGSFAFVNLPDYPTLSDVIDAINPHGEVSIGIGFETYCKLIREGVTACCVKGTRQTYLLPLWDEKDTHEFALTITKQGDSLSLLFFSVDDNGLFTQFDNLIANSFKDQLTGLFNRTTMFVHVQGNRSDSYLCLFDLNKFKLINDTFGHGAGDDVLCAIAEFLIAISTDNEVFYRRSGDEFMILFLKHDLAYVKSIIQTIENFLESIHEKKITKYQGLRCSASFGLLELCYPDKEKHLSVEEELKLTDLAMYQAKKAGVMLHLITYQDALRIVHDGNLDERLRDLGASIKR